MPKEPTVQEIISQIKEEMKDNGWYDCLWSFLSSRDMSHIIEQLLEIKAVGGYICPHMADLFRPYKDCPFSKIKVVILTSLKSNEWGHHGLPMCQDMMPVENLLSTIGEKVHPTRWGKDGVLQLSTAMTSTINAQHHYDIWYKWVSYIVNKINESYPEMIWIVAGKDSEKYIAHIKSPYKKTIKMWPTLDIRDVWSWSNGLLIEREQVPVQWLAVKYQAKIPVSK